MTLFSAVAPVMPELAKSNVNVVCLDQYEILYDPVRVRAMMQGIWNAKAARAMDDLLAKSTNQKVVVHVHGFVKALSSSFVNQCHKRNVPVVLTLHDYFTACPNGGFFDYQQKQLCLRQGMSFACLKKNCDVRSYQHKAWRVVRNFVQQHIGGVPDSIKHFIYISELSKKILQPYLPKSATLHYVPNPIDIIQSTRVFAENNRFYVFIGRLSAEKGIDAFCQTFSKLNYPAIVVGDGENLIDFKNAYPLIKFTGWLDKAAIDDVLQTAKALVFSSQCYETQGLVVYEALAQGIPVVVPRHCSAAEAVEHGNNGFLYDINDEVGLEQAVQMLQNLPYDQVKALSENAFSSYWSKADSISQHVDDLIAIYSKIHDEN
ncbi:MAG: glycosyltransferase family 4 protein [Methyloprofundus sp.]|nr:glycosyltransferase family 4 protein [Methyloprofundus sp.]